MKLTMKWFKRRARLRAMRNGARGRYHAASPASQGRGRDGWLKDVVIHALEQPSRGRSQRSSAISPCVAPPVAPRPKLKPTRGVFPGRNGRAAEI